MPAPVKTIIFFAFRIRSSASISVLRFSGTFGVLLPKPRRPNKFDKGSSSLSELELTDDELREDMIDDLKLAKKVGSLNVKK